MKANERKKQILDVALEAFAKYGYERTSIAIICKKAGVARPTLYQYFKDKRSVFRELLESYFLEIHNRLHERQLEKAGNKQMSPRETMNALHVEILKEFLEHRNLYTILLKEAKARNAETDDIVDSIMKGMAHQFVQELKENPAAKNMDEKDMEFVVVYMLGGLMQVVESYLFNNENTLSVEEIAEKLSFIESRIKNG
jgi:AcrR family transcriptional regulator